MILANPAPSQSYATPKYTQREKTFRGNDSTARLSSWSPVLVWREVRNEIKAKCSKPFSDLKQHMVSKTVTP